MHSTQFPLQTTGDESTLAPSQIQSKIHSRFKETIFIFWHYNIYDNCIFLHMPLSAQRS